MELKLTATPGFRPKAEVRERYCVLEVHLRRLLPLTDPYQYISVRDGQDAEIGIIRNINDLDPHSQAILEVELDRIYFTPKIQKILSLTQEASLWKWYVETQRGAVDFYLRGIRDSIHEVAPNRWHIYSVNGQRYEIQDYQELDTRSQVLFDNLF